MAPSPRGARLPAALRGPGAAPVALRSSEVLGRAHDVTGRMPAQPCHTTARRRLDACQPQLRRPTLRRALSLWLWSDAHRGTSQTQCSEALNGHTTADGQCRRTQHEAPRGLTFELSGWPWQDAWPVVCMIDSGHTAGQAACRGQSALERGVRPQLRLRRLRAVGSHTYTSLRYAAAAGTGSARDTGFPSPAHSITAARKAFMSCRKSGIQNFLLCPSTVRRRCGRK